jgi:hypothetical protein
MLAIAAPNGVRLVYLPKNDPQKIKGTLSHPDIAALPGGSPAILKNTGRLLPKEKPGQKQNAFSRAF